MKEPFEDFPGVARPGGNGNQREAALAERTEEVAGRVRDAAADRIEQARDRTREGFDQGRQQVADRIGRLGSALRAASDRLREEDQTAARYADRAGDQVERAASYVRSADLTRSVRDVEDFARRQPAVFFGGAFLLGLAAGRFLRSSEERRSEDAPRRSYAKSYTGFAGPTSVPSPRGPRQGSSS